MIIKKTRFGDRMLDEALWWIGTTDAATKVLMFHCPKCNQNRTMAPYAVTKKGEVLPVLSCNCGHFSAEVVLDTWNPTQWKEANDPYIKAL